MNEVTAKILSVLENQSSFPAKDGSGTFYKHGIIYEGSSQVWELLTMSPTCTEFKAGDTATFTTETKVNGQYTNHKIRPVKTASSSGGFKPGFKPGGGGFKPKDPKTERQIVLQSVFSSICHKTQGSAVTVDQAWNATVKIYDQLMSLAATPHKSEVASPVVELPSSPVAKKPAPVQTEQPNPLDQFDVGQDDLPF